ncbi:hypothetical protein BC938DRAFT_477630 [Jimgerdemannia flammicorona]|uniref:Uncharacterized protein n=1 Tax=Jimgerdemannia flammicorona TaxID=994334 RepID=A0A433QYT0_9FUNG|nr:hypothetical protein BC938DRAFT_477630 [Jimgerdemannia flammicorona]
MGGEGPWFEFLSHFRVRGTSTTILSDDVYQRAVPFLIKCKDELISEHGFTTTIDTTKLSADVSSLVPPEESLLAIQGRVLEPMNIKFYPSDDPHRYVTIQLPKSLSSFQAHTATWNGLFTSFRAWFEKTWPRTLYVNEPQPLRDIIYTLQIVTDGMLTLKRIDDLGDYEKLTTQNLPPLEWIRDHKELVCNVLQCESTEDLEEEAANVKTSQVPRPRYYSWDYRGGRVDEHFYDRDDEYFDNRDDFYDRDDESDDRSFTACGRDCDYCGHCDY